MIIFPLQHSFSKHWRNDMKRFTHPMRLGRVVCLVAVFIIAITGLQPARAQSESGSAAIEGAVRDGSGAAIA
jgi:hypothetical protein